MVQIFAYFEHMQTMQKLEPTKFFLGNTKLPDYGTPDVPINMVATYCRFDGERSMHHESKSLNSGPYPEPE